MKGKMMLCAMMALPLAGCVTLEGGIYGDGPQGTRWEMRWKLPLTGGVEKLLQPHVEEEDEDQEETEPGEVENGK